MNDLSKIKGKILQRKFTYKISKISCHFYLKVLVVLNINGKYCGQRLKVETYFQFTARVRSISQIYFKNRLLRGA